MRPRPRTELSTLQSFYLTIRQALLHPGFSKLEGVAFRESDMMEPYSSHPSTKIDALLILLQWHVGQICPPPIEEIVTVQDTDGTHREYRVRDEWELEFDGDEPPTNLDKIIVYCGFPSLNWIIIQALQEHCIKFVELNGRSPPTQRAKIIE